MTWDADEDGDSNILCTRSKQSPNLKPVKEITQAQMAAMDFPSELKRIASVSANVHSDYYFDEILKKLEYRLIDILRALTGEELIDIQMFGERGNRYGIGFTLMIRFRGLARKTCVRGWMDLRMDTIYLTDIENLT